MPRFVAPEQRDPKVTADGQRLVVGAYRHHRAVDTAVPRIEDIASPIGQAVAFF